MVRLQRCVMNPNYLLELIALGFIMGIYAPLLNHPAFTMGVIYPS